MESERLREMGLDVGPVPPMLQLFRGKGREKCINTGYAGRTCILEMMPFAEPMRKLTTAIVNVDVIRTKAREEGMRTLRESAIEKLLQGTTTIEEVLRVTWEQQ